jgi:hypothetical protein
MELNEKKNKLNYEKKQQQEENENKEFKQAIAKEAYELWIQMKVPFK